MEVGYHLVGVMRGVLQWMLLGFHLLTRVQQQDSPVLLYPCGGGGGSSGGGSDYGFCNKGLGVEERVRDLVGRLSLEEKAAQLGNSAAGVARLGIPPYEWWSEALHGVSNTGPGTSFSRGTIPAAVSFPQVILSAASFNTSLWKSIGQVVSTEARAMYNQGQAGLTFWSPNINILRDPRWGRGQETPGEDPFLASHYAINYVRGLQDVENQDPQSDHLKVAACCKHYTAYDLDNWKGVDRFHFDAQVTQQDLDDTYQPPFKNCIINGNAACVMCSYNRVNGVPTCVDKNLLIGTVREQWGLNGYVASDCDSVEVLYNSIHYTQTPEDAVAEAIIAGLNMNCGVFLPNYTMKAVSLGKLNETTVDVSLSYLYTVLMRLGYFDGDPTTQTYGSLGPSNVCTKEHRDLAIEAAKQGIVLLKNNVTNQQHALPLSKKSITNLAIIGPNANVTSTMIGNYAGVPCLYTTPLQGLSTYTNTTYQPGCADVGCANNDLIEPAVQVAKQADIVILVMGLDQSQEREGFDRTTLTLPGEQKNLILQVANASKSPVILVVMSGGPIDVGFAQDNPSISSILWVGYPGEAGGQAIAEVIFGDYNPAGRLPMSWYPESYADDIKMTDMQMRPNATTGYPGRTYRFYTGETLYEFGHGLSFTTFTHTFLDAPTHLALTSIVNQNDSHLHHHDTTINNTKLSQSNASHGRILNVDQLQCDNLAFTINVNVRNAGNNTGDHVVIMFWSPKLDGTVLGVPKRQVVAFNRIHRLGPGESTKISLDLNVCEHLSYVNAQAQRVVPLGAHMLTIDESQHEIQIHQQ